MILKTKRILSKNINKIKVPSDFVENPPKPEKLIVKTKNSLKQASLRRYMLTRDFS